MPDWQGASGPCRANLASARAFVLVLSLVNGARWAATIDAP
jgi:hypothetical protein